IPTPDYPRLPTPSPDPLAQRGSSPSASSTYCCEYACVVLSCEEPRRASVSARLATASMNNQGCRHRFLGRADTGVPFLKVTSVSHARSNSATVQACAVHVRGVNGGTPSKIWLRVPST